MVGYPPFPKWNGSITSLLMQIIMWIIEVPLIAVANVIIVVVKDIGNTLGSTGAIIIAFPATIFKESVASFSAYGVFAPIIASFVWGISIIILVFFVFKALQIGGSEMENEV
jgi:lipopolysaccharide export LptBFGC system permease protein LptF